MTRPVINIAIADDHPIVRNGLKSMLELLGGFNVLIQAENGKDLLTQIGTGYVQPDICLVDISMPVMDGYQTVSELKNKYPFIKTLAISVFDCEQMILRMYKNGVNGYLMKNSSMETIRTAIERVYDSGSYYPEELLKKFPKIAQGHIAKYNRGVLTDRELEFLMLCCSDMTYAEIAEVMKLSPRTVQKYCEKIGEKIGVHGRIELALYAQWSGLGEFKRGNIAPSPPRAEALIFNYFAFLSGHSSVGLTRQPLKLGRLNNSDLMNGTNHWKR